MNKRQRKTVDEIMKHTPMIAVTFEETTIQKGDIVNVNQPPFEEKYMMKMNDSYHQTPYHRHIKGELRNNLAMFLDNYIMCGGTEILILTEGNENYKVHLKINKKEWNEDYWSKRDKNLIDDPLSIDDDTYALYQTICKEYNKINKVKKSYKLN